jgi:8-oxo-dGTP diphosphatase
MPYDPKVHVGAAAVIVHHPSGKLLVLKRGNTAHGAGQWSIPGGWIDHNETPEQAVLRELKEEIGLVGKDPVLLDVVSNTFPSPVDTCITVFYEIPYTSVQDQIAVIKEPDKLKEIDWVYIERLVLDYDLFPPLASFLEEKGMVGLG